MGKPISQKQHQAWAEKILCQKQSGLSIDRWCKNNQIAPHLFHYWKRRLFPNAIDRNSFAELTDQKNCIINIECQDVHMRIESPTLKRAFQILRELRC